MQLSFQKIKPLLKTEKNPLSRFLGYLGLLTGMVLLLVSLQMFFNIRNLLTENPQTRKGYDFISVSKSITNDNMGRDNRFTKEDIANMQAQPFINDVSPLITSQFQVRATAGSMLPFSTDLFLESLDKAFLDTLPPNFDWKPGQTTVPLILSSDFLELYNVFAPAQGLPQLSPKTVSSVSIFLECAGPDKMQTFKGHIVGLSDRVSSILAPVDFLKWSNQYFAGDSASLPSRVFVKLKDSNDPAFGKYLDSNGLHVNKEKIKYGRIKSILQNVIGVLGVFGVLVILLAVLLFSFYVRLNLAKSKENISLLLTLGYSPSWLSRGMTITWIPFYASVILLALVVTQIIQFAFTKLPFVIQARLPIAAHWSVPATSVLLFLIILFINSRMVKKELQKID